MSEPSRSTPRIRPPAVAGTFYPADRARLGDMVRGLVRTAQPPPAPPPRALIAPHAGYRYSGPVAATAYAHLEASGVPPESVLLVGPAHYVLFDGLALPGVDGLATPLGTVVGDRDLEARVRAHPAVHDLPEAHRPEHSLEVHLPFLQVVAPHARVVALAVGRTDPAQVATLLVDVLGSPTTLVVVSSDLSHYLETDGAKRMDAATAEAIEALQPDLLAPDSACGSTAIRGLLSAAGRLRLGVTRLDLRNSGDTAGSPHRVVGYGAWSFG